MYSSDYEAMGFHAQRSADLVREADQDRLAARIAGRSSGSGILKPEFAAVLGALLITWGERLKKMS